MIEDEVKQLRDGLRLHADRIEVLEAMTRAATGCGWKVDQVDTTALYVMIKVRPA